MRKISVWRVLCLCGALCAAAPLSAQDAPMPVDVTVPDVDVADSVRRMLETARTQQGQGATGAISEHGMDSAPLVPAPIPVPTPASVPAQAPAAAPPAAGPVPAPPPPAAAVQRQVPAPSNHVPLPEREFTIRSVDDIRELARELEEAKQRQRR